MNTFFKTLSITLLFLINFSGCAKNPNNPIYLSLPDSKADEILVQDNLNELIADISTQLKQTTKLNLSHKGSIAVTSFVNLEKFNETTKLGRVLGESMFYELFVQGFNVSDFRGKTTISINKDGEFYISRDVNKLDNEVANTYVLVGTYTNIDKAMHINVRIMDNTNGKLVASARSIYQEKIIKKEVIKMKKKIKIKSSDTPTIVSLNRY